MPLPIGLVKEPITHFDQANTILANAQAEGKRAVVVNTSNGRTLRIVKARNWIEKFTSAISGQNKREKSRLEQYLNDLSKQGGKDGNNPASKPTLQERDIKVIDPVTVSTVTSASADKPVFLTKSTTRIYDELRSTHAESPIREFLIKNRISLFSDQGALVCKVYDALLAAEIHLLEDKAPKPTKDEWGLESGGIRIDDNQFGYILARIEEALEKNNSTALPALLDNVSESASLEASTIKNQLDGAIKGKDYDLWETVSLIKKLRKETITTAVKSEAVPQSSKHVDVAPPTANTVTPSQPQTILPDVSDIDAMPRQNFNTWLAEQIKNKQFESLWNISPALQAKGNFIRSSQIRFAVKLGLAEQALSVNKESLGWTSGGVTQRARVVASTTSDHLQPNSQDNTICSFRDLERKLLLQISAVEAGMIADRTLEN